MKLGCLEVCDFEQNVFRVGLEGDGTGQAEIEVDLAGDQVSIVAPPVVNDPIEPRVFVLKGDGYGYELVRQHDYEEYGGFNESIVVVFATPVTVTAAAALFPRHVIVFSIIR